jgi:hypothetical protein
MRQRKLALVACALSSFAFLTATSVASGQEVAGQEATTGTEVPKS